MFKVPDWETDIPKSNVEFSKKAKNNKADKINVESSHRMVLKPTRLKNNQKEHSVQHDSFINNSTKKKSKKHKKKNRFINEDQKEEVSKVSERPAIKTNTVNAKKYKSKIDRVKKEPERIPMQSPKVGKKSKLKMTITNGTNEVKTKKKSNKRKHESNPDKIISNEEKCEEDTPVTVKKIKFTDSNNTNSQSSMDNIPKNNSKKEKIKKILELQHRSTINVGGNKLRERMLERLKAAQFRYLNEKLYTSSGNEAKEIFQSDPEAFKTYHQGYQQQIKKWPVNPLDFIVKKIQKMPKTWKIADMGCGLAALSSRVPHAVHSFDLVASSPAVTACDMAHTPLLTDSVDVVVYCLALMGTELTQYLVEANRVLKTGGQLLIAEVESRFDDVNTFSKDVEKLGFKLKEINQEHSVFFFLHFVKNREPPGKKSKLPQLQLKPCLYKKR